jgi:hypothetical protein
VAEPAGTSKLPGGNAPSLSTDDLGPVRQPGHTLAVVVWCPARKGSKLLVLGDMAFCPLPESSSDL